MKKQKNRAICYLIVALILILFSIYYEIKIKPYEMIALDFKWYYLNICVFRPLLFFMLGALLLVFLKYVIPFPPLGRKLRNVLLVFLICAITIFIVFWCTHPIYALPFTAKQQWFFLLLGGVTELCLKSR